MRKYVIALLIAVLIFGRLDSIRELTDLAVVKAFGIDLTEDGKYHISAIVIDTSDKENSESGIIYESTGDSVHDAARNIVGISPKKLYLAHMETLIISEEIAKDKMENVLDFFIRDNEGSNAFYLFIANGNKSSEIIDTINQEKIDMVSFLKSSEKYRGNANLKNLNEIIKTIFKEGIEVCVNSISVKDDKVLINNMAYFKDWQMKDYLSQEESVLYNVLTNEVNNIIMSVGSDDNLAVLEIVDSKSKISIDKQQNNKINIKIDVNGNLSETSKKIQIKSTNDLEEIQKSFESKINSDVIEFCNKIKNEYNTDILGIGNLLYRKKNTLYIEENYLQKLSIDVETNVNISNQGGINKKW